MILTKKITATLVGMSMLAATSAFAGQYDIPAGGTKVLDGASIYGQATYKCDVRAESFNEQDVDFIAMKKRSYINGQILEEGKSITTKISIGHILKIEIDTRGKLSIVNKGSELINISCNG